MRINGTFSYRINATSTFDEDGVPVSSEGTWSDRVECFIKKNRHDNKGIYVDGKFTVESYLIILERIPEGLSTDFVRIWKGDAYIGEFLVQDISDVHLDRIIITV